MEITAALKERAWAESLACLLRAPGIGLVTAYAGLAPMPCESGRTVRGRPSSGHVGHHPQAGPRLRTALYMATLSAARYNPAITAFYDQLRAAGKPMKVARCAAARKLLHLAWALVTKLQHFDPARQQHALLADQAA